MPLIEAREGRRRGTLLKRPKSIQRPKKEGTWGEVVDYFSCASNATIWTRARESLFRAVVELYSD
jgi:hypothetical protein